MQIKKKLNKGLLARIQEIKTLKFNDFCEEWRKIEMSIHKK